jgi:TBC1 domain family member 5
MMLDILFIYTKLNPDLGYRQGMHELLAPILWVVERDAINQESFEKAHPGEKYDDLMLQSLDVAYIEHDSFSVFCSIMQMVRVYYEHSNQTPVAGQLELAPIVSRCQHIHQAVLMAADYELAKHLHAIEILPQIFLT